MVLEKKKFIIYMEELKQCIDNHDELAKVISKLNEDGYCLPLNIKEEELIVKLLADLMEDEHEIIQYFVYELFWGKSGENAIYDEVKGVHYNLQTPEDLYNYIVGCE